MLNEMGQYVFMVENKATKPEVKKAVKQLHNVDVVNVRIVNKPGRNKNFRGVTVFKPGYKKAIVTLKAGQKIDLGI